MHDIEEVISGGTMDDADRLEQAFKEKLDEWNKASTHLKSLGREVIQIEPGVKPPNYVVAEGDIREAIEWEHKALRDYIDAFWRLWNFRNRTPN